MITTSRTQSTHPDFVRLIQMLDFDLHGRYNTLQTKYDGLNKLDLIETVVVAYDGQEPVGCGCFKTYDAQSVEVKRMFVHPDHRGRRISKLILSELENWAKELGYEKAVLETGSKQHEAIGLYSNVGYQPIENYGPYKDMPNSRCFEKIL